jgi:hypothetical protein
MRETLASKRQDVEWSIRNTSGEHNPNYGGGKYIDDKGYVRILDQNHPYSIKGYIYEHRSVFENYLNRHLQPWETVHHINEIKTDNRVQNLFLCTVPEHSAVHREGKKPTDSHRKKMRENMHKRNKETRENKKKNF